MYSYSLLVLAFLFLILPSSIPFSANSSSRFSPTFLSFFFSFFLFSLCFSRFRSPVFYSRSISRYYKISFRIALSILSKTSFTFTLSFILSRSFDFVFFFCFFGLLLISTYRGRSVLRVCTDGDTAASASSRKSHGARVGTW